MQQLLLKSNMLQSPFILGEGRDSLKGTETGSSGGREPAIKKKKRRLGIFNFFFLAKNFAFPSVTRGWCRGWRPGASAEAARRQLGEEKERKATEREREKENGAETKSRPSTRRLSREESGPKGDPGRAAALGSGACGAPTRGGGGREGPIPAGKGRFWQLDGNNGAGERGAGT